ncbi:periplasmic nitrate reductase, NapE protein [Noviherbaspirillum denitrificans]|uniref:Nitrate reductase n=1 Tax=Noviherbaspirillum denitrificans TaxID=1968433 RepID=A0A254TEQ0_9BURK|nr:periplasmic nitrate reductase, NapE protein [Noviherbaspirillum denitrificans]OWW20637.1 nitrate reductase [Noviherbaspirillum denitrificans]
MADNKAPTRAQELRAFLLLTVITAPILAVAVVGGYGFSIWMIQLMTGSLPTS